MFQGILSKIISVIMTPVILIGTLWNLPQTLQQEREKLEQLKIEKSQIEQAMGAVNTVAGKTYYLYGSGIGTSDTSITLTSFKTPVSNYNFSMSDFGTIGYLTIEPGNSSRQEFISFTALAQNSDGTATISGVTRGLSFVSPYTASTTLQKAHSGGSTVIISNPPQLYEELATKANNQTISGLWTFGQFPVISGSLTPTTTSQFATKGYADNLTNQGAATSTTSNGGIVELGTRTEAASTTPLTAQKPLVLTTDMATSTPGANITATGGTGETYIPVTEDDGKLNQGFLDLTENFTFSSSTANNFQSSNATTTNFAATGRRANLGGVYYNLPANQEASSTVMVGNGSGSLIWDNQDWGLLSEAVWSSGGTTTLASIPARRHLQLRIYSAGISDLSSVYVSFNSSYTAIYSSDSATASGVLGGGGGAAMTGRRINLGGNATTTASSYTINVLNDSGIGKFVDWTGILLGASTGGGGSQAVNGGGFWNNTNQVTKVEINTDDPTKTFLSGTKISVYGSRN